MLFRSRLGSAAEVLAVGHTVQWLVFYGQTPMVRVDSLEELQRRRPAEAWVVACRSVLASIRETADVVQVLEPDVAGPKVPVLARVRFRR